ncbi:hypothetical protein RRG08_063241 [Elysia crispata]|uniref:Uncharacterized protein n=1 Tax=Elysia crispata TaxID=231223 RepID=A0AAE0YB45_9GAST|nr:hypothetical protein RRG08_063241 [Elysia crispata]
MSRRTNEQANRLTAGSGQLGKSVQVCGVIISDASSSRKSDLRSDPVSEGDNSRHKISIFFPIILLEVKEAEIIHLSLLKGRKPYVHMSENLGLRLLYAGCFTNGIIKKRTTKQPNSPFERTKRSRERHNRRIIVE